MLNKKLTAIAAFMLATGMFFATSTKADMGDAEGAGKKIVLTGCYLNGTLVGYANDCDSGSGQCVDTTCN